VNSNGAAVRSLVITHRDFAGGLDSLDGGSVAVEENASTSAESALLASSSAMLGVQRAISEAVIRCEYIAEHHGGGKNGDDGGERQGHDVHGGVELKTSHDRLAKVGSEDGAEVGNSISEEDVTESAVLVRR